MFRRVLQLSVIILQCLSSAIAQPSIGKIKVSVFTKSTYKAGTQNWKIERDTFGRVFIANNEGLLVYNGMDWQLYPVPNKTILRSIAFDANGKLYAGAQNEFGFFEADPLGKLVYTSLKKLLPPSVNSFADIWNIEVLKNEVFFIASDIIFRYAKGKLTYYKPHSSWLSLEKHQNTLIAQDRSKGLLQFAHGQWETMIPQRFLPAGFLISDIKPFGKDTSLVSTSGNGLFLLTQKSLLPFLLKSAISEQHFTSIDILDKAGFLVGSYNTGLYKIDRNGSVLDRISTGNGLIGNTIRCIYTGKDAFTWIGLDNSIAMIDWNNPISHFNPQAFNNGSGYGAAVLNGDLYFALTTGLQWLPIKNTSELNDVSAEPTTILTGLTWNVSVWGNQIMAGRDDGLWSVSDYKAANVSKSSGFWNFKPIDGISSTKIACGNYAGIQLFGDEKGELTDLGSIKNFVESSRYLEADRQFIWVSHPYHGLFKIDLKDGLVNKYTTQHGLPTNLENYVFKLKGKIVFATTQGIYELDPQGDKIIPSPTYQKILGKRAIRYLKEDKEGNIWFVHDKLLGVVDLKGPKPVVKYIPELQNRVLSGFENIFTYNSENVLVGSDIGFYNINYTKYREKTYPYFTYLTLVKLIGNRDSVLYGGFDRNTSGRTAKISLPFKFNSIHFSFASSMLLDEPATEFSYYLEGYSNNWSEWELQHEKEYTNLPEGKYIFHVKARFGPSYEFKEFTYSFKIEAPWYRTIWAYLFYLLIFVVGVLYILRIQKKRLQKKEQIRMLAEKKKFEEEQRLIDYHYKLELEKKEKAIIQLKNQNLESELQHKNAELASTAMNLLQKKEFLARIAEELNKVYLPIKDLVDSSEIKRILRTLSSKGKEDEEWKQFSIHFNNVHSNYLITLKKEFPDLNAHDMKLCAYLRMNLSSKEIAQLLSISVRGVEISRYRLRKKLKLKQNEDLYQFLFNLAANSKDKSDDLNSDQAID